MRKKKGLNSFLRKKNYDEFLDLKKNREGTRKEI
jgi:hypothetical protein